MDVIARMSRCGVVPVVAIDDVDDALPLAEALLEGGVDVIEMTLRTPAGLSALERIAKNCPNILPIAGTVVHAQQVQQVVGAGARLIVSPGFTEEVADAINAAAIPWLPGVASASDLMRAMSRGFDTCKFFPAEQAGGTAMLKALAGPFPGAKFCPTGGIGLSNLKSYLSLANVIAVGGSWLIPAMPAGPDKWARVTELAREARAAADAARAA